MNDSKKIDKSKEGVESHVWGGWFTISQNTWAFLIYIMNCMKTLSLYYIIVVLFRNWFIELMNHYHIIVNVHITTMVYWKRHATTIEKYMN
jgi:hypothetical protein